jgi:hypothetical protein
VSDGSAEAGAAGRPALRVVDAGASPEEVAAIVAAVTAALGSAAVSEPEVGTAPISRWVTAARLRARGAGVRRGEWRRYERIGPRVQT